MIIQFRQNTTNNSGTISRCAQCAHILIVPSIWFVNWADDGSMSQNMAPDLWIDNNLLVMF